MLDHSYWKMYEVRTVLVKVEYMIAIYLLCTVKAPQEFLAVIMMIN